jgi:hypothetical protein
VDRIIGLIKVDSSLFSPRADERLRTAQAQSSNRRTLKALVERAGDWPPFSPGSFNAWLLLVTTKPPNWRDNLVTWPEAPLGLGRAHEGFFYPDPLGFWAEVRRWTVELFRLHQPTWNLPEALSLTTLLHLGDESDRLRRAVELSCPRTILFLDEPSWERAGYNGLRREPHFIADPHRSGQVYEGFWGKTDEGVVVGKSPQHPSTHNFYKGEDMLGFVRSAPLPDGV